MHSAIHGMLHLCANVPQRAVLTLHKVIAASVCSFQVTILKFADCRQTLNIPRTFERVATLSRQKPLKDSLCLACCNACTLCCQLKVMCALQWLMLLPAQMCALCLSRQGISAVDQAHAPLTWRVLMHHGRQFVSHKQPCFLLLFLIGRALQYTSNLAFVKCLTHCTCHTAPWAVWLCCAACVQHLVQRMCLIQHASCRQECVQRCQNHLSACLKCLCFISVCFTVLNPCSEADA